MREYFIVAFCWDHISLFPLLYSVEFTFQFRRSFSLETVFLGAWLSPREREKVHVNES